MLNPEKLAIEVLEKCVNQGVYVRGKEANILLKEVTEIVKKAAMVERVTCGEIADKWFYKTRSKTAEHIKDEILNQDMEDR